MGVVFGVKWKTVDKVTMDLIAKRGVLGQFELEKVKSIFDGGTALNTRRAYKTDLDYFFAWAALTLGDKSPDLPIGPALLVKFITDHVTGLSPRVDSALVGMGIKSKLGPHAISTISRRVSALSFFHKLKGLTPNPCTSPEVTQLLSKARKWAVKKGYRPEKKTAATLDRLNTMLASCDHTLSGVRTRALLLFAFSSGGRRASEIANAVFENLTVVESNYTYQIAHSKTDQEGHGHIVPICGQAADALKKWLTTADINEGKIFRGVTRHGKLTDGLSPTSVSRIIKKHAALAGLDPKDFSSHSLRSGFVTEGGRQNHSLGDVMALSGHKTVSVAMGYFQAGAVLNNPANSLAG